MPESNITGEQKAAIIHANGRDPVSIHSTPSERGEALALTRQFLSAFSFTAYFLNAFARLRGFVFGAARR